jgi:hypothetical protein
MRKNGDLLKGLSIFFRVRHQPFSAVLIFQGCSFPQARHETRLGRVIDATLEIPDNWDGHSSALEKPIMGAHNPAFDNPTTVMSFLCFTSS